MDETRRFVVAGGFGIDTNVYVTGDRFGAEMTFASVVDGPGQAGCHSALAAAALGVSTHAIAALGADRAGAWVRDALESAGITVTELRDPGGTHRSVNLVGANGDRRNYFDPRDVSQTSVDTTTCRASLLGASVLHCHLDDWCRALLPIADQLGVPISCDLQDVLDIDDPYRADFVEAADIIFMSAANLNDPEAAALELGRRRHGRLVVVGAGASGCLVAHDGRVVHDPAPGLAEPIVDTNGAGDNLAVGFLVARLLDGLSLERAVRRAQIGARWICSQRGDAKSPITRSRLDALESHSA